MNSQNSISDKSVSSSMHIRANKGANMIRYRQSYAAYALTVLVSLGLATQVYAQHQGDIALDVVDGSISIEGTIGGPSTSAVFYGEFGDSGFSDFTSNPGFDALPNTFPTGRIGFQVMEGLRRWDQTLQAWLEPSEVDERLRIWFITLERIVEDEPMAGFDLAIQPNGGWHKHLNFQILGDGAVDPAPGMYRLDLTLYSTMGIGSSDEFAIAFDFDATTEEVESALASFEPEVECAGDLNGDNGVTGADIGLLLAQWGESGSADLNGDGTVNGADIGLILSYWGVCS